MITMPTTRVNAVNVTCVDLLLEALLFSMEVYKCYSYTMGTLTRAQ